MKAYDKILFVFAMVAAFMSTMPASAEESASAIVGRCASRIKDAQSVTVGFTVEGAARPLSGTLTISRSRFKMETPEMTVWYDGHTQWSFVDADNEVSITEPTAEELMESNPFEIIVSSNSLYRSRKLKAATGFDIVELIPKSSDASISNARITFNRSTGWPTAIQATFSSGASTSIAITGVQTGKAPAASTFVFDRKAYPTAELVDLR